MNTSLALDYASKSADYYAQSRPEILEFVPSECRMLLDVGCGAGEFGQMVKRTRPQTTVWGIEPMKDAAGKAAEALDSVQHGEFSSATELPEGRFDCVTFNDVIEHLMDPNDALAAARRVLKRSGVVVASVPNIRYFPAIWDVVVRGNWTYADSGIFDRTHLKFYTRRSLVALFENNGYEVLRVTGINPMKREYLPRRWLQFKLANAATLGRFSDMQFLQNVVVARPKV